MGLGSPPPIDFIDLEIWLFGSRDPLIPRPIEPVVDHHPFVWRGVRGQESSHVREPTDIERTKPRARVAGGQARLLRRRFGPSSSSAPHSSVRSLLFGRPKRLLGISTVIDRSIVGCKRRCWGVAAAALQQPTTTTTTDAVSVSERLLLVRRHRTRCTGRIEHAFEDSSRGSGSISRKLKGRWRGGCSRQGLPSIDSTRRPIN